VAAEVYKDLAQEYANIDRVHIDAIYDLPVEAVLEEVVTFHVEFHRQLLDLNFDCRYHRCFDPHQWVYDTLDMNQTNRYDFFVIEL
jgi:hypothetical protein